MRCERQFLRVLFWTLHYTVSRLYCFKSFAEWMAASNLNWYKYN